MDSSDAVFEANADLDSQALRTQELRKGRGDARQATTLAPGGFHTGDHATDDEDMDSDTMRPETSPLLRRTSEDSIVGDGEPSGQNTSSAYDFSHLPWYRRPSIFWVLVPFFFLACAFGGVIAPKMNLILQLICRQYMSEQALIDPNFTYIPVDFNGGHNSQCRIPEVSSRVSQFNLWGNLIAGILSAIVSPRLGALSDRFGRKPILMITATGTILGEIITICAASFPETFPVQLMYFSYALEGITGSFVVTMAIANSYASDCTPPERRNVAFGYFHSCLFSGIAIGPVLAGYLVKETGRIVIIFYILIAVHSSFLLFVGLFVPESLSKERQVAAREFHHKNVSEDGIAHDLKLSLDSLNFIKYLRVLCPTGPGTSPALRRNLIAIAAVDTICFGVAMGSMSVVIIYTQFQFGWESFESGRFLTIVNSSRAATLLIVFPLLTRLVRGKASHASLQRNRGADTFDLLMIRVAILFDTLGYAGYTMARSGAVFAFSGAVAAIGGIGSPTLQSALTKHVSAEQTGQLLGASGLLHALARVVAPTIFNAIYAATVGKFTQTVFVCLGATFGLAFLVSWLIAPHVYFDEDAAKGRVQRSSDGADEAEGVEAHVPIADSVADAASHLSRRVSAREVPTARK